MSDAEKKMSHGTSADPYLSMMPSLGLHAAETGTRGSAQKPLARRLQDHETRPLESETLGQAACTPLVELAFVSAHRPVS